MRYLNPLEVLGLNPDTAEPSLLKKARRRFLTELELEEKDSFDFHGETFTQNDLDEVITASSEPEMLGAFSQAAKCAGLSEFLVTGQNISTVDGRDLRNPALLSVVTQWLVPAVAKACTSAVAHNDFRNLQVVLHFIQQLPKTDENTLYGPTYQLLSQRADQIVDYLNSFSHEGFPPPEKLFPKGPQWKLIPPKLLWALPNYFQGISGHLFEPMGGIVQGSGVNQVGRILDYVGYLRKLPHLDHEPYAVLRKINRYAYLANIFYYLFPSAREGVNKPAKEKPKSSNLRYFGVRGGILLLLACLLSLCDDEGSRSSTEGDSVSVSLTDVWEYTEHPYLNPKLTIPEAKKAMVDELTNPLIRHKGPDPALLEGAERIGSDRLYEATKAALESAAPPAQRLNIVLRALRADTLPE